MKTIIFASFICLFALPNLSFGQLKKTEKIVPREAKMEQKEVQKISINGNPEKPSINTDSSNGVQSGINTQNIENEVKEQVTVQTNNGIKTATVTRFENGNQTVTVLHGAEAEAKIRDFESKGGKVKELNLIKKTPPARIPKNK